MSDVTTNGPSLYAQLAYRMRVALGEFDDPNRDLEGLVKGLAEFKRAHLTQPAQGCEHDWAEGYGVPAYCKHCGVARETQPAQAVDVGAMLDFAVSRAEKFVGSQGVVFALRFEPMANQGNLRDYLTAALPKNVQEKPVACCPKCAANQPHHTDPNSSGCLHLCDVCNSVVEY